MIQSVHFASLAWWKYNMEHRTEQTDQNVIEKDEWPGADEVTYSDTMTECALPTDLAGAGAVDTAMS